MTIPDANSIDLKGEPRAFNLSLADADKKNVNVLFYGNMVRSKVDKRDALSGSGDIYYQLDFILPRSVATQEEIDLIQIDMNEEQANTYFNAIKSLELAKIRREINWVKWLMVAAILAASATSAL